MKNLFIIIIILMIILVTELEIRALFHRLPTPATPKKDSAPRSHFYKLILTALTPAPSKNARLMPLGSRF